jgi:uncharacterized protein
MTNELENQIIKYVEEQLSCSAHDLEHVFRVYNLALKISENDNVDLDVLRAAVLLHDIARVKEDADNTGNTNHAELGAVMAGEFLRTTEFPIGKIHNVEKCIRVHRFRTNMKPESIEEKILFDADKLDSVGAIGVARSFGWVGKHGCRIFYRPDDLEAYIIANTSGKWNGKIQDKHLHSAQIEFDIKLKHMSDLLYTEKAKKIAKERIAYFQSFMDRLKEEVKGEI